ncbi:MAG: GntR family transcriptional regulator [Gammaproteobacteria bacterium]
MLVQIDTHSGVPLYRQLMGQVTRMIVSGELAEGEQLESVASLASRLKINPMTISKAYGFLTEGGLVERRHGIGLFVRPLAEKRRRDVRHKLLGETLGQAATLAVQLGLDEESAGRIFVEEFKQSKAKLEGTEE